MNHDPITAAFLAVKMADAEPDTLRCRQKRQELGLPYSRSSCGKCGSILRPGWRCADEARPSDAILAALTALRGEVVSLAEAFAGYEAAARSAASEMARVEWRAAPPPLDAPPAPSAASPAPEAPAAAPTALDPLQAVRIERLARAVLGARGFGPGSETAKWQMPHARHEAAAFAAMLDSEHDEMAKEAAR